MLHATAATSPHRSAIWFVHFDAATRKKLFGAFESVIISAHRWKNNRADNTAHCAPATPY
jgi:hypothetical protein